MRAADIEPIFTVIFARVRRRQSSTERVGFSAANYTHARLPLGLYAGHVAVYQHTIVVAISAGPDRYDNFTNKSISRRFPVNIYINTYLFIHNLSHDWQ